MHVVSDDICLAYIDARLAVYKVVYRDGGYLSDVLAGVDQASKSFIDAGLWAKF